MNEHNLTAAQRGYRMTGKRLLPRCGHTAHEMAHYGARSVREFIRAAAAEYAAQYGTTDRHQRKCDRALGALSGRARKQVERAYADMLPMTTFAGKAAMLRAHKAIENFDCIEKCMQWDADMLRNAY